MEKCNQMITKEMQTFCQFSPNALPPRSFGDLCAEGTLECGGLTPPSDRHGPRWAKAASSRRTPRRSAHSKPSVCRSYFRKRFSKAWRASSGLEVEVSRSTVVRREK